MKSPNDPNWMVLYTRSKWEKKVNRLLNDQNIVAYCPLVKTSKKWVDRQKVVEIPLFNSYIFVYARHLDLEKIVQTTGVVTYISYCGKPAIVRGQDIENIRAMVNKYHDLQAIPLQNLNIGDEAAILSGPWNNYQGAIQKINGKSVVMILKSMNYALTIRTDLQTLTPISKRN
ncbi:UpxY family transcription antiterminator [Mucilaginibacter pallidiroseus]|uniref:UpxY family transcription antiterminator n=1 Tax=Mucilaginibacter pallidiroseus TaxID=2599295 RepID=A0A563UC78_9SPHI|nr:UpxY family transcription antiterminator [Mucilaginibacter pallidiroseus]TWR28859.1 UpxY family transcription antiterminator [Mucilaginibacter pallidiroseus]